MLPKWRLSGNMLGKGQVLTLICLWTQWLLTHVGWIKRIKCRSAFSCDAVSKSLSKGFLNYAILAFPNFPGILLVIVSNFGIVMMTWLSMSNLSWINSPLCVSLRQFWKSLKVNLHWTTPCQCHEADPMTGTRTWYISCSGLLGNRCIWCRWRWQWRCIWNEASNSNSSNTNKKL